MSAQTPPTKKPRPLSPHLQVYNMFAITSLTSMLHRITGAALVVGSLIVVYWLMAISHGPEAYSRFENVAHHPFGQFILYGFLWAFWYQLLNGCRHLLWDTGIGLKLKTAKLTGKLILVGSVLITLVTWYVICSQTGAI